MVLSIRPICWEPFWSSEAHLLGIAGQAPHRCGGDLVENVVAGNGVLDALAIAASVVAVEIKRGHQGTAMEQPQ